MLIYFFTKQVELTCYMLLSDTHTVKASYGYTNYIAYRDYLDMAAYHFICETPRRILF